MHNLPRLSSPIAQQRASTSVFKIAALILTAMAMTTLSTHAGINEWSLVKTISGNIAIDPRNPNTIYQLEYGLSKSTDGGNTWTGLIYFDECYGYDKPLLKIDPNDSNILFAGCFSNLYKSGNGGVNWQNLAGSFEPKVPKPTLISDLLFNPKDSRTIYLAARNSSGEGVYRSTDGGNTWAMSWFGVGITKLAINPQNPKILFAGGQGGAIYESTDAGENWSLVLNPGIVTVDDIYGASDMSVSELVVDPLHPNNIFTADDGYDVNGEKTRFMRSRDGGATWINVLRPYALPPGGPINTIVFDPLKYPTIYAGGRGGVFRSTDFGHTWEDINRGLPIVTDINGQTEVTGVTKLDLDLLKPSHLLATTYDSVFEITLGGQPYSLFVPVVLSSAGLNNSFYTTELTLTNRGSRSATLTLNYTAASGGGGGTASTTLPAGSQEIFPDAISYLRELGINIPDSGSLMGTLKVQVNGTESEGDVAITARTTTAAAGGRAGLAYAGVPNSGLLNDNTYIFGLRQTTTERSNLALQNAGGPTDGPITLGGRICYGDAPVVTCHDFPEPISLEPGEFRQFSGVLDGSSGSKQGFAFIYRNVGSAPFYAYGVINDQGTSDGSFVPPLTIRWDDVEATIPVIVESSNFASELTVTNVSLDSQTIEFKYTADAVQTSDHTARFSFTLQSQEQRIIPNLVQELRNLKIPGIGPAGPTFVGSLFARLTDGYGGPTLAARTVTRGAAGKLGVYYPAVRDGEESTDSAWLYGLQQNAENRTNLALVNTGSVDTSSSTFNIELYDGVTGSKVATISEISLAAHAWMQFDSILAEYAPGTSQGYARVKFVSGTNPYIAYAVINDGAQPGERSGDGAFISSAP